MKYLPALLVVVFASFFWSQSHATWKPDYALSPPDHIAWFNNAETTPAAQARLNWKKCCDHSERYKTKFLQGTKKEEWYFQDQHGDWKVIPADVIHTEPDATMPAQLKTEGVLFLYPAVNGQPTCFWPPETGG